VGTYEHHVVLQEWFDAEILTKVRSLDKGELYLVRHKCLEHRFGIATASRNPNAWISLDETGNEVWKQVLPNRLRSPDCQLACLLSRGCSNSGKGLIRDLFHFVRKRQQHPATCC
jgi:hypothetical protein